MWKNARIIPIFSESKFHVLHRPYSRAYRQINLMRFYGMQLELVHLFFSWIGFLLIIRKCESKNIVLLKSEGVIRLAPLKLSIAISIPPVVLAFVSRYCTWQWQLLVTVTADTVKEKESNQFSSYLSEDLTLRSSHVGQFYIALIAGGQLRWANEFTTNGIVFLSFKSFTTSLTMRISWLKAVFTSLRRCRIEI